MASNSVNTVLIKHRHSENLTLLNLTDLANNTLMFEQNWFCFLLLTVGLKYL